MLGWRIKSALFIDYENVSHRSLPDTIPNWLAWLEDGEFDDNRKRRLLQKRVYWNTMAEQHREKFEKFGFTAVLCEKFAKLKNGADIRMALDIFEATIDNPKIKEFILITRDSDFIPVLQRLQTKSKRTVVLVDEQEPQVHATYSHHADIVIPARIFRQAAAYTKPVRSVMGWLGIGKGRAATARGERSEPRAPIDLAVDHVIRVTSLKPNRDTARKEIEGELRKIKGFTTTGRNKYLGKGSYPALMREIQKRTDRIKVVSAPHGGVSVRYIPKDEE